MTPFSAPARAARALAEPLYIGRNLDMRESFRALAPVSSFLVRVILDFSGMTIASSLYKVTKFHVNIGAVQAQMMVKVVMINFAAFETMPRLFPILTLNEIYNKFQNYCVIYIFQINIHYLRHNLKCTEG